LVIEPLEEVGTSLANGKGYNAGAIIRVIGLDELAQRRKEVGLGFEYKSTLFIFMYFTLPSVN
jgi:hypothetical protein